MNSKFFKIVLLIFIGEALFISCNNQPTPTQVVSNQPMYFKTLLVIGDDRSGSTNDIRKFSEDDYRLLLSSVAKKGGGTVAVSLIGNPKPESKEPYSFFAEHLENIEAFDPKDSRLTLTQRGAIKAKNDKILEKNRLILEQTDKKITDFIHTTLVPNIINYKASGNDFTDLEDALSRINTLINEQQYQNYDRIIVALASDGVNQPGRTKLPISGKIHNAKTEVYLIGWETQTNCFDVKSIEKLSEKSELLNIISNLNHD